MDRHTESDAEKASAIGQAPTAPTAVPRRWRPGGRTTLTNSLVALGSAAVLAVYTAGFVRTEPAAAGLVRGESTATGVVRAGASATPVGTTAPTAPTTPTLAPALTLPPTVPATAVVGTAVPTRPSSPAGQPPSPTAPSAQTPPPAAPLRDGAYVGTGSSRHGSIEATVTIRGGAIVSAEITRCGTRYPCSKIAALPGQVVARQGPTVDVVSGATDSVTAYRGAITAALAKAR